MILLAEDSDGLAKIYSRLLLTNGFEVRSFSQGHAALDFLRENSAPELIIVDLVLPDMDGVFFAKKARAQGFSGPMIAISGELRLDDEEQRLFAGVFLKPLRLRELLDAVRAAIGAAA